MTKLALKSCLPQNGHWPLDHEPHWLDLGSPRLALAGRWRHRRPLGRPAIASDPPPRIASALVAVTQLLLQSGTVGQLDAEGHWRKLKPHMPTWTVADATASFIDNIQAQFLTHMIGTDNLAIWNSLHKQHNSSTIVVEGKHEAAVVNMHLGYHRASGGGFGVALVPSGVGYGGTPAALRNAYVSFCRLLLIVGQVRNSRRRNQFEVRRASQYIDPKATPSQNAPIAKEIISISSPGYTYEALRKTADVLLGGFPAPVVLEIPRDVAEAQIAAEETDYRRFGLPLAPRDLSSFADRLRKANRPVIVLGDCLHGADATDLDACLSRLANLTNAVVLSTYRNFDVVDHSNPAFGGSFALLDTPTHVERAVRESDLILYAGDWIGEYSSLGFEAHIRDKVSAVVFPDAVVLEECRREHDVEFLFDDEPDEFLYRLQNQLELSGLPNATAGAMIWRDSIHAQQTTMYSSPFGSDNALAFEVASHISRFCSEEGGYLVTDVGSNANQYSRQPFRGMLSYCAPPGDLMGVGLPSGIGAAAAYLAQGHGGSIVVQVGDGALESVLGELSAAINFSRTESLAENGVSLHVVCVQDGRYGVVDANNKHLYGEALDHVLGFTDYGAGISALWQTSTQTLRPNKLPQRLRSASDELGFHFTVVDVTEPIDDSAQSQ